MKEYDSALISVIIPFYKELQLIGRAVQSAVDQELPRDFKLEVVIANDGDFDEAEVRSHLSPAANAATRIVSNLAAKGAGNARNAALDAAAGQFLAFLDADDYWCPSKLVQQIELLRSGANFVATGYRFEGCSVIVRPPKHVLSTRDFLRRLRVGTSTVMITRELCSGARFSNLRFSQDTEFWARLSGTEGFRFASTPGALTVYAPSMRTANKAEQLLAFRKVVEGFSLPRAARLAIYIGYIWRGILNHYVKR